MTLDEAYRHIKESYIHHSRERNAVFLPQAELIAMECIEKCKQADAQPTERVIELKELLEECRRKFLFLLDCEIENTITAQQVRKLIEKIKAEEV